MTLTSGQRCDRRARRLRRPASGNATDVAVYTRRGFEASPESIRKARAFLREAISDRAGPGIAADLELALSELATNAVRHAGTAFEVVVELNGKARIEVEDSSTEPPVLQPNSAATPSGRGMHVIEAVCDRWGVHIAADRKCVWCERELA